MITKHNSNKYIVKSLYNTDNYVAIFKGVSIWPNGIVRMGIDPLLPDRARLLLFKAMEIWREQTNIGFEVIPYEEAIIKGDSTYKMCVKFDSQSTTTSAYATIGTNLGKPGLLVLSSDVMLSSVIHVGHTVGFIHEHQRPSRDNYMTFQEPALIGILPILYSEDPSRLDINDLEGTANPRGLYYRIVVRSWIKKLPVYSDDTNLAPFDCNSIMNYASYGSMYPVRKILMEYNAPIYREKLTNRLCSEPQITDPYKLLTELDIRRVNLVYPLRSDL
ncbi:MAG: M12 family metallopeptidase [Solitalea-like symbiont of Acarus siro]